GEEKLNPGDLQRIMEEAPVVKLANLIISQAVRERASDILIEPMEKNFRVRYRIDGILHVRHTPPRKYHRAIISRLKVMADLNIAESRLPQDGRFQLRADDHRVDFRLSIIPSILGEKASLRVLDRQQIMVDITKLGLCERDRATICSASESSYGMILACGPTGSGKTTTLYSILKYVDSPGKNLVTVEDPVEYELKGIGQVSVNSAVGLTFAGCLRSILRQDPDDIMIGEIRDFETVDIAIKSALTGHLVLSSLHTSTAPGSVVRLVNMGVEPFLIASSVILVVAQRLLRILCPECKKPYAPAADVVEKYGLLDANGKVPELYEPSGCERCSNSGYHGRSMIVECMRVTPNIKDLLFRRQEETEIRKMARDEGMVTLRENGIERVLAGETSLEEVVRITAEDRE
ncbi:MAG: GspE/PulE family protein, partial [Candidatus Omnitrophica bacterium]|nr:GspE/PulE family protein [Candidatus Omnitrophota bacterium]